MAIVFGSNEARIVLLKDFQRRNGPVKIGELRDAVGGSIEPPTRYVPAAWEPVNETEESEDWDDFDEGGELGGGTVVHSGWQ